MKLGLGIYFPMWVDALSFIWTKIELVRPFLSSGGANYVESLATCRWQPTLYTEKRSLRRLSGYAGRNLWCDSAFGRHWCWCWMIPIMGNRLPPPKWRYLVIMKWYIVNRKRTELQLTTRGVILKCVFDVSQGSRKNSCNKHSRTNF